MKLYCKYYIIYDGDTSIHVENGSGRKILDFNNRDVMLSSLSFPNPGDSISIVQGSQNYTLKMIGWGRRRGYSYAYVQIVEQDLINFETLKNAIYFVTTKMESYEIDEQAFKYLDEIIKDKYTEAQKRMLIRLLFPIKKQGGEIMSRIRQCYTVFCVDNTATACVVAVFKTKADANAVCKQLQEIDMSKQTNLINKTAFHVQATNN